MRALPCLPLFPLALLAGCDKRNDGDVVFSSDPMLGCFRIDQEQGRYYVSFNRDEQWQREATPLQEARRDEVASYFPSDADQIDRALVRNSGGFGLFHLKPDATLQGKAKDSDYMTLVLIGAGPVFRTGCD